MEQGRAVMYIRVSTNDQTLDTQEDILRDYISHNPELMLTHIYKEKISGAKDTRPQLDLLLQDARQHKFDVLVVYKVDRLGRHTSHMLQVVEELHRLNITLIVTSLGIDTKTSTGWFVFGLLAQIAELERAFIRERIQANVDMRKKQLADPKKGYYINKDGVKRTALGRPVGSKDRRPRPKRGYYLRQRQ